MNRESNRRLKELFLNKGITKCEICGTDNYLSWAHRAKRRYYNTVEELSDFNSVILACIPCHNKYLEWDGEIKEEWFKKLRH